MAPQNLNFGTAWSQVLSFTSLLFVHQGSCGIHWIWSWLVGG